MAKYVSPHKNLWKSLQQYSGLTRSNFAAALGITEQTTDKLLSGQQDSEEWHLRKALAKLDLPEELAKKVRELLVQVHRGF